MPAVPASVPVVPASTPAEPPSVQVSELADCLPGMPAPIAGAEKPPLPAMRSRTLGVLQAAVEEGERAGLEASELGDAGALLS